MSNDSTLAPARERFHALDALRAFVLLLGVVYHAALSFVLPQDGTWAVGVAEPSVPLWWFIYYAHSFRMEAFFLLAGFFAALVVQRRGAAAFLRDRAQRILLVFTVAVWPMTFLVTMIWIDGGLATGWLKLPPGIAALPLWRIALGGMLLAPWYEMSLGHLWFLWYLAWISGLFMAVRWVMLLAIREKQALVDAADRFFGGVLASRLAPLWIALPVLPWLVAMPRYDVDSPIKGLLLRAPALAIYGSFFVLGWWLYRRQDVLAVLARRWPALLGLGLIMSFVALWGEWLRIFNPPGEAAAWGFRFVICLTMSLSVLGWLGLFVAIMPVASARVRYVADASYWLYLAHIPIVVALQVWLVAWDSVWMKLAAINVIAFAILFASYHWLVRFTWAGRWLNGPRARLQVAA